MAACNPIFANKQQTQWRRVLFDQIDEMVDRKSSGFIAWDNESNPKHNANASGFIPTNELILLQGGFGRIRGKYIRFEAQSVFAPTTYGIVFINVGLDGRLTHSLSVDLDKEFPLFQVFTGASTPTAYYVARENHSYAFNSEISTYLHRAAGTVISGGGANIVAGATLGHVALSGAALYEDHGLITVIPDSGGAGVTWIQDYKNTLAQWQARAFSPVIGAFYNNAGTPTALTTGEFAAYRLYVVKDDGNSASSVPRYIAIMHTAKFASASQAKAACDNDSIARADGALDIAEVCQLGFITIKGDGVITYVRPAKTTLGTTTQGLAGLAAVAFTGAAGDLVSGSFSTKISARPSASSNAGINIGAVGTAPSSPVDGDIWKSATDALAIRMSTNTRTIPFLEKTNTFTTSQTARGWQTTGQSNTPTGTTYTWTLTSGNALLLTLTSSTGDVKVTTASPTATVQSFLSVVGHASASRSVTISQTGVTFVMTGKTSGTSITLDTIAANQRAHYCLFWASTTLCFITRRALV